MIYTLIPVCIILFFKWKLEQHDHNATKKYLGLVLQKLEKLEGQD